MNNIIAILQMVETQQKDAEERFNLAIAGYYVNMAREIQGEKNAYSFIIMEIKTILNNKYGPVG
jgi:hypothetical protein